MNDEIKIKVKYDPYNGDYVIEQEGKDNIRVERWVWAVIDRVINEGKAIEIWKPQD